MTETRYVFHTADAIRYRFPTHTNDLLMDRAEAETSEAFIVILEPGEAPPLHAHHDTEQVFYVLRGAGRLEIGGDAPQFFDVRPGDLVRIPAGAYHRIHCEPGGAAMAYLSIDCFLHGRPAAEPTWDSHVRANCAAHGWDFDAVRQG